MPTGHKKDFTYSVRLSQAYEKCARFAMLPIWDEEDGKDSEVFRQGQMSDWFVCTLHRCPLPFAVVAAGLPACIVKCRACLGNLAFDPACLYVCVSTCS